MDVGDGTEAYVSEATARDTVIDLIPTGLVWAILRRYVHAQPGAGSQLAASGNGTAGRDAACTVAQKLARCPLVEKVLFLEAAADWIRTREGFRSRQQADEHARCVDLRTLRWAVHCSRPGETLQRSAARCLDEARKVERTAAFGLQFALMTCELSACWAEDRAFRAWVDDKA